MERKAEERNKIKRTSEIERKRERQEILEFQKESASNMREINSIMRRIVQYTETV